MLCKSTDCQAYYLLGSVAGSKEDSIMDKIKTRAAVAWGPGQPLAIEEVDLMPPQKREALIRIVATGVCHTDAFTKENFPPFLATRAEVLSRP